MLYLYFNDFNFLFPLFLNIFIFWFIFFRLNTVYNNEIYLNNQVLTNKTLNEKKSNLFFIIIAFYFLFFIVFYFIFFKSIVENIWWNHFYICENNLNYFLLVLCFNFLFFSILRLYYSINVFFSYDLIFSLISLNTLLPFFFFINNLFLFFFYLELVSIFIFFLFVVSKVWKFHYGTNLLTFNKNQTKYLSLNYINLLFFQFWGSFLSSVIMVFSILLLLNFFSSLDWILINFLNFNIYFIGQSLNQSGIFFIFFFFLFALMIKMGFTPVHFFKLEIYKGLTFLIIFLYTTFYFLIFFLLMLFLFIYYLNSLLLVWFFYFFLFLIFGIFVAIHLLFDVNYLKFFFAYSSIMNSIVFFFTILIFLI